MHNILLTLLLSLVLCYTFGKGHKNPVADDLNQSYRFSNTYRYGHNTGFRFVTL